MMKMGTEMFGDYGDGDEGGEIVMTMEVLVVISTQR